MGLLDSVLGSVIGNMAGGRQGGGGSPDILMQVLGGLLNQGGGGGVARGAWVVRRVAWVRCCSSCSKAGWAMR